MILALLLALTLDDREGLTNLTRHYEEIEGTLRHDITFVEVGAKASWPWCAYSGRYTDKPGAWIEYDLNCLATGRIKDVRDMAAHEVCHQRLGHHELDYLMAIDPLALPMMEKEATQCARKYRGR